jgi:hypothetical protein
MRYYLLLKAFYLYSFNVHVSRNMMSVCMLSFSEDYTSVLPEPTSGYQPATWFDILWPENLAMGLYGSRIIPAYA